MSVLINGMEMPDSCFHCKLAEVCQYYKKEHYANKRHDDCPIEEVPETHDKHTKTHACDLIERQAVLNLFPTHDWKHLYDAVKELPSAELATNLQQSCNQLATDCISRQAAIDALHGYFDGMLETDTWSPCDVYGLIEILPSAQPEHHFCRDCKYVKYYGNVNKYGSVESYWHCMNWDGGTDEEGFCHEWARRKENGM